MSFTERRPMPKGATRDPIDRQQTRISVEMTEGPEGLKALDDRRCPSCKEDIPREFDVGIELREWQLSGLCPKCQRELFNPRTDEAGNMEWQEPEDGD